MLFVHVCKGMNLQGEAQGDVSQFYPGISLEDNSASWLLAASRPNNDAKVFLGIDVN